MKHVKSKAGRKLVKRDDATNPIVGLINTALGNGDLIGLADHIGYQYENLWSVYKGKRKMPILPLYELCKIVGFTAETAIEMYAHQPSPPKPPVKK